MLILLNSAPSCCVPLLIKHAERGMLKDIILLPADPPGGHYVIPTGLTQWRGFTITTPLGQQGATLLIAWLSAAARRREPPHQGLASPQAVDPTRARDYGWSQQSAPPSQETMGGADMKYCGATGKGGPWENNKTIVTRCARRTQNYVIHFTNFLCVW